MKKAENGCIGGCCEEFPINNSKSNNGFTPDDMRKHIMKNRGTQIEKETNQIGRMIIALGYRRRLEDNKLLYMWTCVNFDKESRLCKIYESRPYMCRKYPEDHSCGYSGCNFKEVA